jgi:copper chaperone CopZ
MSRSHCAQAIITELTKLGGSRVGNSARVM